MGEAGNDPEGLGSRRRRAGTHGIRKGGLVFSRKCSASVPAHPADVPEALWHALTLVVRAIGAGSASVRRAGGPATAHRGRWPASERNVRNMRLRISRFGLPAAYGVIRSTWPSLKTVAVRPSGARWPMQSSTPSNTRCSFQLCLPLLITVKATARPLALSLRSSISP